MASGTTPPSAEDLRAVELSGHYRRQIEAARLLIRARVMGAADPAAEHAEITATVRDDRGQLLRSLVGASGWTLVAAAFVWQVCDAAERGAGEGLRAAGAADPDAVGRSDAP